MGIINRIDNVRLENIVYMLSYVIDKENEIDFDMGGLENCKTLDDLLCRLLLNHLSKVTTLERYYIKEELCSTKPTGRLDIYKSIRTGKYIESKLYHIKSCYTDDIIQNRLIKTALYLLSIHKLSDDIQSELNNMLTRLRNISLIDLTLKLDIDKILDKAVIDTNYKVSILLSNMIVMEYIETNNDGTNRIYSLSDSNRLKYIFEAFVRNYYRLEYKDYKVTHRSYKSSGRDRKTMIPDIVLNKENFYCVIDTKWYTSTSETRANIYQVTTYGEAILSHYKEVDKVICIVLYSNNKRLGIHNKYSKFSASDKVYVLEVSLDMSNSFNKVKQDLNSLIDTISKI